MCTPKVCVVPYDDKWKQNFLQIRSELESALGDLIIGIVHVGSTSVEGLSAKPIIDLDIIIPDYTVFPDVVRIMESIGYIHEGDLGIPEREAFKYSDKPHLQRHHVYVCPQYSKELHRHITFRDYLITHPDAASKYGSIKEIAARQFPDDIDKYIQFKTPCIEEIYRLCGL